MRRIIAVAVLLAALATPSWAGFDEGMAAYERGDYATALREFRALAEQSDTRAQTYLGSMYDKGDDQDFLRSVRHRFLGVPNTSP